MKDWLTDRLPIIEYALMQIVLAIIIFGVLYYIVK
jgi:hypothetical protein